MTSNEMEIYKIYRFQTDKWVKTDTFSDYDIVLAVDSTKKHLYYYEGSQSTAQDHELAKRSLIRYKNQYSQFAFSKIDSLENKDPPKSGIPQEILTKLNNFLHMEKNL
ncbi:MAG: hypothetical protein ACTSRK_19550 [Promethearchaeota archaeon]